MGATQTGAPRRRWSNQQLRREVDQDRARRLWSLLLGVVVAASPLALCLLQQNDCITLSYQINQLREDQQELVERQRRLQAELAELHSLESIETWAERQGMIRPTAHETVVVRRSTVDHGDLLAWESGAPAARRPARDPEGALRR